MHDDVDRIRKGKTVPAAIAIGGSCPSGPEKSDDVAFRHGSYPAV